MKNQKTLLITLISLVFFFFLTSISVAGSGQVRWVPSDPHEDCNSTCKKVDMYPASSGSVTEKGEKFNFVCAYNHDNRGIRPGFNRQNRSECVVGTGGRPSSSRYKDCLCTTEEPSNWGDQGVLSWMSGRTEKETCPEICGSWGAPLVSGVYSKKEQYSKLYETCSVGHRQFGFDSRSGFAIEDSNVCVIGTGGRKSVKRAKKDCLCTTECSNDEIYDCNMNCVSRLKAKMWIGDGFCDDGKWGIDLVCANFLYDKEDCRK